LDGWEGGRWSSAAGAKWSTEFPETVTQTDVNGPHRTFDQAAANDRSEPTIRDAARRPKDCFSQTN